MSNRNLRARDFEKFATARGFVAMHLAKETCNSTWYRKPLQFMTLTAANHGTLTNFRQPCDNVRHDLLASPSWSSARLRSENPHATLIRPDLEAPQQGESTMRTMAQSLVFPLLLCLFEIAGNFTFAAEPIGLSVTWDKNYLTIRGDKLPGREMKVLYLEAYCRPGSTDRDWGQTVIGHTTEQLPLAAGETASRVVKLKCLLKDGVTVQHTITAKDDEIDFQLVAHNPTDKPSQADWAQPCIRVGEFTGLDRVQYVSKSFVFVDGHLMRMPLVIDGKVAAPPASVTNVGRDPVISIEKWAMKARYIPGQVWAGKGVDRNDVNPRPLSNIVLSNGLIGCYSADESMVMATAFEPYQELFQGVAHCVHSDFRIGGLKPGETKPIRGKIYFVKNDIPTLLKRYEKDFPEHVSPTK